MCRSLGHQSHESVLEQRACAAGSGSSDLEPTFVRALSLVGCPIVVQAVGGLILIHDRGVGTVARLIIIRFDFSSRAARALAAFDRCHVLLFSPLVAKN